MAHLDFPSDTQQRVKSTNCLVFCIQEVLIRVGSEWNRQLATHESNKKIFKIGFDPAQWGPIRLSSLIRKSIIFVIAKKMTIKPA